MDYPRTSDGELPDLYEVIDEWLPVIERTLRNHFPVQKVGDGVETVEFHKCNAEDWVKAIDENREEMTSWTQKMTGFSDRELQRQHGIRNAGAKFGDRKSSLTTVEEAYEYGEVLANVMPAELTMETCLYTWAKMYENDQRRFVRMDYEGTVLDELNDRGFPARKGEDLPGQPDVVIPESAPYSATGEVRVFHQKDKKKRYKEFRDEARKAKENFPNALFVVVANPGDYVTRNDREELRSEITSEDMDGVYFYDELDELADDLDLWGVPRQQTFGE